MAKKRKRRKRKDKRQTPKVSPVDPPKRDFTALIFALVSYGLLWLAMPGRDVSWLAWIAMVPTVWLIQSPVVPHKVLRQVWIASLLYWLAMLHFVRLPFWALWFGWIALATYLSIYGPLFVSISRTLVHRLRVPTIVAVPVVFTGLEWIRVNFLTGFGLGCVSHSQYKTPEAMQLAPIFGAWGVTFAILFVAAAVAVASSFAWKKLNATPAIPVRLVHAALAVAGLVGVFGYGTQRLQADAELRKSAEPHKHLRVALIQSSIDTILAPQTAEQARKEFIDRCDLTHSARLLSKDLDLIVWPESSFPYGTVLSDIDATATKEWFRENQLEAWQVAVGYPGQFSTAVPLLVGSTTVDPQKETAYNSALLFDENGNRDGAYHKNHLVMFGEYFPVLGLIPVVKDFVKGFSAWNFGTEPTRMMIGDVSVSPSICFETTVPQLIRRHINTLEESGSEVDVLVNVTNDGWFFGTSCLDLHFACNTFRAVETRKPMLISANTGLSAYVDELGRHVEVGPRRKEAELICDVRVPLPEKTVYRNWGSWVACVLGWLVVVIGLMGLMGDFSRKAAA